MEKHVIITEVCPRDGWQNHPQVIPTETKLKYIRRMIDYGAKAIDATSFVNPKVMPQMADADAVIGGIREYANKKGADIYALTLNAKGVARAAALGVKNVEFVLSASEEHNRRNSNRPIADCLADMLRLRESAGDMRISLGLACVFGSPFGDKIDLDQVVGICRQAAAAGIRDIGLADTAGISDPLHTRAVLRYLKDRMSFEHVSVHLHDTRGMGLANAFVALEEGIFRFESALAGMGGCPFARGAKGNIASEDLVNMCHQMGYETGYDLTLMLSTAKEMCAEIGAPLSSSMALHCSE